MRTLTISSRKGGDVHIPLHEDRAIKLIESGVLYECGEPDEHPTHDLHIVPSYDALTLENVEDLCLSIVFDQTPWR